MAQEALPNYLAAAKPNPMENRAPWNKNTAPSYAGIFLSVHGLTYNGRTTIK